MKLYSYCLRFDDGAAPNPYFGVCTLVICKPAIRRVANIGDWVVGLGSARSPVGDVSGCVVYAMQVTNRMTMKAYDGFCRTEVPGKVPRWRSSDFRRRVGDCIYDFSGSGRPAIRRSVHGERNRKVDLSGKNALLSEHFFYFGSRPRELPEHLGPIVHQTQGHKSLANAKYVEPFVSWIEDLGLKTNRLYGTPQFKAEIIGNAKCASACSARDLEEDIHDEVDARC